MFDFTIHPEWATRTVRLLTGDNHHHIPKLRFDDFSALRFTEAYETIEYPEKVANFRLKQVSGGVFKPILLICSTLHGVSCFGVACQHMQIIWRLIWLKIVIQPSGKLCCEFSYVLSFIHLVLCRSFHMIPEIFLLPFF